MSTGIFLDGSQQSPGVPADGSQRQARGDRTGIAYVQDWKAALAQEGRVHRMTVGTITAGGNISMITGGGNGTTIDQDQPEFGVSVATGTILIPLRITIMTQPDVGAADLDEANIVVSYDAAAAYADDGTVTAETPVNALTAGGVATAATAFSAATADITDPTVTGLIAVKSIQGTQVTAASSFLAELNLDWVAAEPLYIQGPGAFYGYWGGTAALPGMAEVVWAEVPESRYAIS